MSLEFIALVMAGGRGTRFWPESTSKKPKQYLGLTGGDSLLKQTLDRLDGTVERNNRYIITVEEQKKLALESARDSISHDHLILEPSGRNTAPCIFLSLIELLASGRDSQSVVGILPSDHIILNSKGLCETLIKAKETAETTQGIVTIGIRPNFPHTGYGYIEKGVEKQGSFTVKSFKEKPTKDVAQEYLKTGNYFWNAGMFVATIQTLLKEFETFCPEIWPYYGPLLKACQNKDSETIRKLYSELPKDSIDYAIMEKSERVYSIPAEFDWNDLGSWDALESVIEKIDGSNVMASGEGLEAIDSTGNIIYTPGKVTALIGLHNHVVISNDEVVAVFPKNDSQRVKELIAPISKKHPDLV